MSAARNAGHPWVSDVCPRTSDAGQHLTLAPKELDCGVQGVFRAPAQRLEQRRGQCGRCGHEYLYEVLGRDGGERRGPDSRAMRLPQMLLPGRRSWRLGCLAGSGRLESGDERLVQSVVALTIARSVCPECSSPEAAPGTSPGTRAA